MKKILRLVIILLLLSNQAKSQSITPIEGNEYCPLVNTTFTVTIPGSSPFLSSWTNSPTIFQGINILNTSSSSTTFTFIGSFRDVNITQVYRVSYTDASSQPAFYYPTFKKIKSLFYPNPTGSNSSSPCLPIFAANQSSITAAPCQIVNNTISVSTAKWSTFAEGSDFCWGSISTYEYLLPNNWSIGANVSNGSSWIGGGSSVTVTSDLSTGNGMTIKVRPANNCGSSLQNGIPPAEILISRPKPLLTFTGGYAVCTSQNFQANSVPGWVSNYTWLVTPNTVFGNSNPTSNPTTVTKIMDGEGDIQLTISSGSCPLSFVYNTMEITGHAKLVAGKPFIQSAQSLIIYGGPGDENELCRNEESIVEFTTGEGSTTTWTYVSHNGNPQPSWTPWGNDDVLVYFFKPTQNTLVLDMDASNTCGTTSYRFGFIAVDCEGLRAGKKNLFKISPNPAYDMISIVPIETLERKTETKFISEVTVSDFSNNVVNRKKFDKAQTAQLSIGSLKPGIYYITIVSEKYTETQKIIKK